jgi:hypothetical protein
LWLVRVGHLLLAVARRDLCCTPHWLLQARCYGYFYIS